MYYNQIYVWHNVKKNIYYSRKVFKFPGFTHEVGDINGYGHKLVLIIDLTRETKKSLRMRLLDFIINKLRRYQSNLKR